MLEIVRSNLGGGRDDLIQAASRSFGFSSTSSQLRVALMPSIEALIAKNAFWTEMAFSF